MIKIVRRWGNRVLSSLFFTLFFLCPPKVLANKTIFFAESLWPPYVLGNVETGKVTGGTAVELVNEVFAQIKSVDVSFELMLWKGTI
ncbi:MAG: hypothetical protein ACI88A_000605 [Paraglaciecola sp.]|jgi:hypothetical protein